MKYYRWVLTITFVLWLVAFMMLACAHAAYLGIGIGWYEPTTDTLGAPLYDLASSEIYYYVTVGGVDGPVTFGVQTPASSPQGGQWMTTLLYIPNYMEPGLPVWDSVTMLQYNVDTFGRRSVPFISVLPIPPVVALPQ